MKSYPLKLKYILLPFLALLSLSVVGYTFWNWLLCIKLEWINLRDDITNLIIPMVIALALPLFFMKKNINRLKFRTDKVRDLLYIVIILGICVPLLIAQNYINSATGEITHLNTISEIDHVTKTKYYTLESSYMYTRGASIHQDAETSGKYNEYLNLYIYCVVPIVDKLQDTLAGETHYWYCIKYNDRISNSKSDAEKEIAFRDFSMKSQADFSKEKFSFTYLERLNNEKDAKYYGHAASMNKWARNGEDILLMPEEENYEGRNGGTLGWIFKSAGIAILLLALMLLCYKLKTPEEWNRYNKKIVRENKKGWRENYAYLIPQDTNFITPLLAYANILLFLWLVFTGAGFVTFDSYELIKMGSLCTPYIKIDGEYWRLFTYMFLHGGLMHIFNNLISLIFVSIALEPLIGRWKFLTLYILCGLGAGITSLLWHNNVNSVGASGAIFGLYSFMLIMILMKVTKKPINQIFILIACISLGLSMLMGFISNVDNAAHTGGLLTGALLGLLTYRHFKQEESTD